MADQDVALMRIGVECAYVQHLMQVTVHNHAPDLIQIATIRSQFFRVGDRAAIDIGHGKDAFGGQLIDDGWAGDQFFVINALLPKKTCVFCLHAEIKFSFGNTFNLSDHRFEVDDLFVGIFLDDVHQVNKLVEKHEVFSHHVGDQRALYLGNDSGTILEDTIMDLCDRCGSQWFIPKLRIDFVDFFAGFLLDDGFGHSRVQRLYAITQLCQFPAIPDRQKINPAGHDLADLYIGWPKIFQGRPKRNYAWQR